MTSPCFALTSRLQTQDADAALSAIDALRLAGATQAEAEDQGVARVLQSLLRERAALTELIQAQTGINPLVRAAGPQRIPAGEATELDVEWITLPADWTQEAFEGPQLSRREDDDNGVRAKMLALLGARNQTLRPVDGASVLARDIATAADALEYVRRQIEAGDRRRTEVPVGPVPHVLRMLGAPTQMMQMDSGVAAKVLVDKHSADFADVSTGELVRAVYEPAAVLQNRQPDEFELLTGIVNRDGVPIMVAVKVNTRTGTSARFATITSAYARSQMVAPGALAAALREGLMRYVDLAAMQALEEKSPAVARALGRARPAPQPDSPSAGDASIPFRATGSADFPTESDDLDLGARLGTGMGSARGSLGGQSSFARAAAQAINSNSVRGRGDLINFIAERYRGDAEDMPRFSAREAPDTPEFRAWFEGSKVVDEDGKPAVMYHGTAQDISAFRAKQAGAIFVTPSPRFANTFSINSREWMVSHAAELVSPEGLAAAKKAAIKAIRADNKGAPARSIASLVANVGTSDEYASAVAELLPSGRNIMPLYAAARSPFDFRNAAHRKALIQSIMLAEGKIGRGGGVVYALDGAELSAQRLDELLRDDSEGGNWSIIENDGVQSHIRASHDSFYVREGNVVNLAVYSSSQLKSATGNSGAYDPADDDIRYSQPQRFNLRPFNIGHETIEAVQNRYNRWKHVIEDVRAQGGVVTEENDFNAAEVRYWGVVGAAVEDFRGEVEGFVRAVAKDRLMLDDVALYAYAKHAPERNAYIAGMRQTMPDGGSGMSDQDAADIVDAVRNAGLQAEYERHWQTLQGWVQGTRDSLLANGLIDQDEYGALMAAYEHYMPLRGLKDIVEQRRTGAGFSITGRGFERAKGRKSQARHLIENVVNDRVTALVRAGKNEVARAFLAFALDNPDPSLWEVNAVRRAALFSVDANGDRIVVEVNQIVADDSTIAVKDGGQEVRIVIRDEKLREQLKNLNAEGVGRVLGAFMAANRTLARLYTSLNPTFTVTNGLRDIQSATMGVIDTVGFLGVPRLYANLLPSLAQSWGAEMGVRSQDYEEFRRNGGKTGYFGLRTLDDEAKELQSLLQTAGRSPANPAAVFGKALSIIEGINGGIENSVRLAAYKTARQTGMTEKGAAGFAKEITVNFNRRGAMTNSLGAYFLFFNAAVQGTARIVQAMANPKVLATLGVAMTGVAALALQNASMGEDDDGVAWWDKIGADVKERNLVIVLPAGSSEGDPIEGSKIGRYIKVPMPYGYNFFAVVANTLVDRWRNEHDPKRGVGTATALKRTAQAALNGWVPAQEFGRSFDNERSLGLAAVPDALNPLAQVALNVSAFGRPMRPDSQYDQNVPDSQRYFGAQHGTLYQRAAQGMNEGTGGDRYRSGLVDVAPSTIEALARGYGGGPVGFSMDVLNALYARQSIARTSLRPDLLPFGKQFWGRLDERADNAMGYDRINEAAKAVEPFERAGREGDGRAAAKMAAEFGPMVRLGDRIRATRKDLSTLRKAELAVINGDGSSSEKYIELMALSERRRRVMQRFNTAFDRVRGDAAGDDAAPAPDDDE